MATFGDSILYLSIIVSVIALLGLLLKELKNNNILARFVSPLVLLAAGFLTFAYMLITYYFVTSDFTYEYVWQYSSRDLPFIYKLSGAWAGQQGTYLLWAWVIFLSAAWLALTTKHATPIARRTQIITLAVGVYLIILTLVQTPFKSIYEGRPDLLGFVPPDGSGLNALLVNFWMVIHPPLIFIGYAVMTIPFAAAVVYLLTKDEGWEEMSRQWSRFTWLFLGLGIAVGGVWAYLVLGWGGFWAWDPVETASFIPWLTLTGFLHAAALHRKNKATFSIAAPVLAIISFILILYAAIVVRSGLFNSVHAFGETSTGTLLITLILIIFVGTLILGMRRYFEESEKEEEWGLWSKRNIFYLSLLLFVILAFVSFWGISFPAFVQLTQNLKVNVASDTKNFFNVWSYPFTLILLLALGFCLNYKESEKEARKKTLYAVTAITIIAMFIRTENFYVLDHNSPFFVREPLIYQLLGSISLLSIFPPLIYVAYATLQRLQDYLRLSSMRPKVKGVGLAMVHFGVVFILFGAVISSSFTHTNDRINIPLAAKGELLDVGGGYGVKLIDSSTRSLTEATDSGAGSPGTRISNIKSDPASYVNNNVVVSGKVTGVAYTQSNTTPVTYTAYFKLDDGTGDIWVATQSTDPLTIPEGVDLTARGYMMADFTSPSTKTTYDLLLFSQPDEISDTSASVAGSDKYRVQSVKLEVYQNDRIIGSGIAEYLEGKGGGSGTFPMVSRGITGTDVYVIFQGVGGGFVPLTLKIIPAINITWLGILFFAIGIILIMAVKTKSRGD
ncbi:Cytochrome c biogenesis protein CcsA [uncultured archaeon]|nr:Cytochrome c biogenesis protein CcsA [uncultured archaeon]